LKRNALFGSLLALQLFCGAFVIYDMAVSILGLESAPIAWAVYEAIEVASALGLVLGAFVSTWMLARSVRARDRAESSLRVAQGAFTEVMEEHFARWGLSPAERDVALFSIKGLSTAEIAKTRNTSEGTTKAQTSAVYRKANVKSRAQLLSLFLDELLEDGLRPRDQSEPENDAAKRSVVDTRQNQISSGRSSSDPDILRRAAS
jgi:DNA-binding CsgD family transcriptional regulator